MFVLEFDKEYYICVVLSFIFLTIVFYLLYYFRKKQLNKNYYYRNIPNNLPAGLINYYYKGKISSKTMWITLLDLIGKRYYSFKKYNNDYILKWEKGNLFDIDKYNLYSFEKTLIKFINSILINRGGQIYLKELEKEFISNFNISNVSEKFYEQFQNEIKKSYGQIYKYSNYVYAFLLSFIYFSIYFIDPSFFNFIIAVFYSIIILGLSLVISNLELNKKGVRGSIIFIYFLLILLIPLLPTFILGDKIFILILCNPLLIINTIVLLKTNFYNKKQKELMKNIIGLKNAIESFTNMKHRDIDYINLYDRYYAVSVALDVKLDYKNIGEEFDDSTLDTFDVEDFATLLSSILKY